MLQEATKSGFKGLRWEDEDTAFEVDARLTSDFAKMLADNPSTCEVKEGMIVKGLVVRLTDDGIVIDIGHKSEGEVPKHEFGADVPTVGQTVEVYLDRFEDHAGEMVLSRDAPRMGSHR